MSRSGQNQDPRSARPARSLLMIQLENERRLLEVSHLFYFCSHFIYIYT